MSVRAINWAWDRIRRSDLRPSATIVLLALAHCHYEDTGRCDPSNAYLRNKTGLSERAVRDAIKELAEKRILRVVYRQAKTGRGKLNLNNRYIFGGGAKSAGRMGQDLHPLRDTMGADPTNVFSLVQGREFETEECLDREAS